MHSFRALISAFLAFALLTATSTQAGKPHFEMVRRAPLDSASSPDAVIVEKRAPLDEGNTASRSKAENRKRAATATPAQVAQINQAIANFKSQLLVISKRIQAATATAGTANPYTTFFAIYGGLGDLNTLVYGTLYSITNFGAQIGGGVNLNDLSGTTEDALEEVLFLVGNLETSLASNPAFKPLIAGLSSIVNGPIVMLVANLNQITSGRLLPVVQGVLNNLGLGPVLGSLTQVVGGVTGGVGGLLHGLGLGKI